MLWVHFKAPRFFWIGFQSDKFQFLDKIIRYKRRFFKRAISKERP